MARLSDDRRHILRQRNLMPAYIKRKDALMEEGLPLKQAQEQAFEEIAKENNLDLTVIEGLDGKPVVHRLKSDMVKRSAFKGRTCSISEAIEWAISSFCLSDVKPADCPGPSAWALLSFGRKGNNQMIELFKMASRLVRPAAGEPEHKPFHYDPSRKVEFPDYLKTPEELAEARS